MAGTRSPINKLAAAVVIVTGLLTFFAPFVTTDSPVHGRSEWSPANLLAARADLWQPAPPPFHNHAVLYAIAALYVLMVIALLAITLLPSRLLLQVVAVIGTALSAGLVRTAQRSFGWLFYGGFTHARMWEGDNSLRGWFGWQGMLFNFAFLVFLAVMPVLLWTANRRGPAMLDPDSFDSDNG